MPTISPAAPLTARQRLINEIRLRLGDQMIDLELDPEHYDFAVTAAMDRYRQRSGNSYSESYIFLDIQPDVSTYTLPNEVQEVRSIQRRGIGSTAGGAQVDPFALATVNNVYMLMNPGGLGGGGGAGTLALYDFAMQYQELAARMFGQNVTFNFDRASKRLTMDRRFTAGEQVALRVYMEKPEETVLNDVYSKPWIRDYAVAMAKLMIGEARSKFATIAGPQGGSSLNGDAMKQEAQTEMERLETEIMNSIDNEVGYSFVIG